MLKEWEKFHAEFKKLKSTSDRFTIPIAGGFLTQIVQSHALCEKFESELKKAVEKAGEAGISGKNLSDFQAFKDFATVKKKTDAAISDLSKDLTDLAAYCVEAQKISNKIVDLHKALEKDLKSRKSVTDGRKETEALLDKVEDEYQRLMIVVAHRTKPKKDALSYAAQFPKILAKIIAGAPDSKSSAKDTPDLFQLSILDDKATRSMTAMNKVIRACVAAKEAAPNGKGAVMAAFKLAETELDTIKEIARVYREARSKYGKLLETMPDRGKMEKLMAKINKCLINAERAYLKTESHIKKM
jgi:hypothetical protein